MTTYFSISLIWCIIVYIYIGYGIQLEKREKLITLVVAIIFGLLFPLTIPVGIIAYLFDKSLDKEVK